MNIDPLQNHQESGSFFFFNTVWCKSSFQRIKISVIWSQNLESSRKDKKSCDRNQCSIKWTVVPFLPGPQHGTFLLIWFSVKNHSHFLEVPQHSTSLQPFVLVISAWDNSTTPLIFLLLQPLSTTNHKNTFQSLLTWRVTRVLFWGERKQVQNKIYVLTHLFY